MGDRQKTRLAERRKRQRQRQRARTERVKARNQRVSDVSAATGTRAGEAWTGTVDNLVNQAADLHGLCRRSVLTPVGPILLRS